MKNINALRLLCTSALVLAFGACTTAPKGELSSSANPTQEIERFSADLKTAQEANVDVLAQKHYSRAETFLDHARYDLSKGKDQEKIIDDLRFGREALKNATSLANERTTRPPGLFESRQSALRAGALQSPKLKAEMTSVDDDLSSEASKIEKLSPERIQRFQTRYLELEKKSVIEFQLGTANAKLNGAIKEGASKKTPEALRKSEISMKNAESAIGANINNPNDYKQAVEMAVKDSNALSEVLGTVKQSGTDISEATAAGIVMQKHQISDLKKDLSDSAGAVAAGEMQLSQKNKDIGEQQSNQRKSNVALNAARSKLAIQNAIEQSRKKFSENEAEAFQQGGNLLIRLKSMNFKSGHSELPASSLALLAKVSDVAKSLKAKEIKVEGHTDSLGTSEINQKLSEERASAVATYFKTNGFEDQQVSSEGLGFESPIATNKSKSGRAQNRRVDIIIKAEDSPTVTE